MLTLCDIRPAIMAIIELTNLSPHTVTIFLFFSFLQKQLKRIVLANFKYTVQYC